MKKALLWVSSGEGRTSGRGTSGSQKSFSARRSPGSEKHGEIFSINPRVTVQVGGAAHTPESEQQPEIFRADIAVAVQIRVADDFDATTWTTAA